MCVLKRYHVLLFILKKLRVWNGSKTMWDSLQTSALMHKNLSFIVSETLACVCMPVYAYACMKHATYVRRSRACIRMRVSAYACPRVYVAFIF